MQNIQYAPLNLLVKSGHTIRINVISQLSFIFGPAGWYDYCSKLLLFFKCLTSGNN